MKIGILGIGGISVCKLSAGKHRVAVANAKGA